MTVRSVVLHVSDVQVATAFYRDLLLGKVIRADAEHALLDFVTGTVELRLLVDADVSAWDDDDLVRGFRHVGFKVDDAAGFASRLEAEGVRFRLRPLLIPELGVLITFFFDPDGTVVELVENHVGYPIVNSPAGVAAERRMPTPERPRLDHVGHTITDRADAEKLYAPLGFENIGAIEWRDDRGYRIDWLRAGETVLEIFTFTAPIRPPVVDVTRYGFAAVDMTGTLASDDRRRLPDGRIVAIDPDGLPVLVHDL